MSLFLAAVLAFAPAPGAINPVVTQANIDTTICVPNWTKTVRPPAKYTNKLKAQQLGTTDYFVLHKYEEDHVVPLALGGHPKDPRNLQPELWDGPANAHDKDKLEKRLQKLVCARKLSLATAQHDIAVNWQAAYLKYFGVAP